MWGAIAAVLAVLLVAAGLRVTAYYRQWARVLAPVPELAPAHWFWGVLHLAKNLQDFVELIERYVDERSPRWIYYWVMFLYPVPILCHPEPMKKLLQASDIPKNHGMGGPYRMFLPWLGDGLLVSNGRKWERNRRLLTPAFHFDILKPYVPIFHDVAAIFTDKIAEICRGGKSVDIYPHVSKATLDTMLRCALSYKDRGVQEGDHHPYVHAIQRLTGLLSKRIMNPLVYNDFVYSLTADYREFTRLCDYVHGFASGIIRRRQLELKMDPTQLEKRHLDFLDILLTAKDGSGNGLTDLEIRTEVDTFMFEGHDTTASGISWMLHALAKYPDMQEKMRQEVAEIVDEDSGISADDLPKLEYTTCFMKEALRMYSPVPGFTRKLNKPFTIDRVTLPAGTVIDVYPFALHHNPAVWEDHMEFQPERFTPENMKDRDPFAFLPFSAGQRNCVGQHFAMNEMKVILTRLVSRFDISLDPAIHRDNNAGQGRNIPAFHGTAHSLVSTRGSDSVIIM